MSNNKPDLFALCLTSMRILLIQISLYQDTCQFIARIPYTCLGVGIYVRDSLPIACDWTLADISVPFMCFRLVLMHYIFFLYHSPSSPSCSVVDAVSSNLDKALIPHFSAYIICCGDFNAQKTNAVSILGSPGHLVISVDMDFMVKSTNEHSITRSSGTVSLPKHLRI